MNTNSTLTFVHHNDIIMVTPVQYRNIVRLHNP